MIVGKISNGVATNLENLELMGISGPGKLREFCAVLEKN